jgi:aspartate 1-decarboxylase
MICLNGAAARLVTAGDKIIIMCYCDMTPEEAQTHQPHVVFVNEKNQVEKITRYELHGRTCM